MGKFDKGLVYKKIKYYLLGLEHFNPVIYPYPYCVAKFWLRDFFDFHRTPVTVQEVVISGVEMILFLCFEN